LLKLLFSIWLTPVSIHVFGLLSFVSKGLNFVRALAVLEIQNIASVKRTADLSDDILLSVLFKNILIQYIIDLPDTVNKIIYYCG